MYLGQLSVLYLFFFFCAKLFFTASLRWGVFFILLRMCSLFYIYLKSLQYVFVILWVLACSTQPCAASSICSEDSYLNKEDLQMTELCNKAGFTPNTPPTFYKKLDQKFLVIY